MSLNNYRHIQLNSLLTNLKKNKENNQQLKHLNEPKTRLVRSKSLFCPTNTYNISNKLINNDFSLLFEKNNLSCKYNSIIKNINNIKSTTSKLNNSNNTLYFDYKKTSAVKHNKNRYKYLFKNKYYYKINYLNKNNFNDREKYNNLIINDRFTPKNKLKVIKIYKTLESSKSHYPINSTYSYNVKEYNGFNNKLDCNNEYFYDDNKTCKMKINSFINRNNTTNKSNKNKNYFDKNNHKYRINLLLKKYNSIKKETNENCLDINSIKNNNVCENDNDLIKNKTIVKSYSDNYLKIDKKDNINNNTFNNEQNNKELKKIDNSYKNIIKENILKPNIENYLNKYKGNQKIIMAECINKLNYNYSDDNYNYNYQINYNDIETNNNYQKNNNILQPILYNNIQENQLENNHEDLVCEQNINSQNINNYENNKEKINKDNIKNNILTDEIINNNDIENNFSKIMMKMKKSSLDEKDKTLINSQKYNNRKKINFNLKYPDENINYVNRTIYLKLPEKNINNKYHPKSIFFGDNENPKYTKLFKKSKTKLELLLNKIPKHEYIKGNEKENDRLNIPKFLNQRKITNTRYTNKDSNESKLIKYINNNKNNRIMPPNDLLLK